MKKLFIFALIVLAIIFGIYVLFASSVQCLFFGLLTAAIIFGIRKKVIASLELSRSKWILGVHILTFAWTAICLVVFAKERFFWGTVLAVVHCIPMILFIIAVVNSEEYDGLFAGTFLVLIGSIAGEFIAALIDLRSLGMDISGIVQHTISVVLGTLAGGGIGLVLYFTSRGNDMKRNLYYLLEIGVVAFIFGAHYCFANGYGGIILCVGITLIAVVIMIVLNVHSGKTLILQWISLVLCAGTAIVNAIVALDTPWYLCLISGLLYMTPWILSIFDFPQLFLGSFGPMILLGGMEVGKCLWSPEKEFLSQYVEECIIGQLVGLGVGILAIVLGQGIVFLISTAVLKKKF